MSTRIADSDLDQFFVPRSIAVIGASNTIGKMGYLFMRRLAGNFPGRLYAVNPNETEVAGIATVASIREIADGVDLLIALIPAAGVMEVIEACRPGQARYLLVISSGFGEVSEVGRTLQERLTSEATARGIRTVGPNTVGMMNAMTGINASMMPTLPPGGRGLSCVTQSGGFGMALSMYALDHDMKVAKFCDVGNMVDLKVYEVLEYLAGDPDTEVIGLFLEVTGDGLAFRQAVKQVVEHKPVVVALAGRTAAGRRASLAHLGIAESTTDLMDALPAGVIRTESALELLNASKALLWQPKTQGPRLAIITGTGGIGVEIADMAAQIGLDIPEFSPNLQHVLGRSLPAFASVRNPVDLTPIWWDYPIIYPQILDLISSSGEVDLVIVSITDVAASLPELARTMAAWTLSNHALPAVAYWGARDQDRDNMRVLEAAKIPCYRSTRETVRAAGALTGCSKDIR